MPVTLPHAATQRLLDLIEAIRQLAEGRGNAGGTVTLTPSATTTTVTGRVIGRDGVICLSPRTTSAAAAVPAVYVSAQDTGTFTLTHNSDAAVDRTFRWSQTNG